MLCVAKRFLHAAVVGVVVCCVASSAMAASEHRSHAVLREFQRQHPCPSTGQTSGRCPGYWRDHIQPLACGGADAIFNLQWQTVTDAKAKDKWERKGC